MVRLTALSNLMGGYEGDKPLDALSVNVIGERIGAEADELLNALAELTE